MRPNPRRSALPRQLTRAITPLLVLLALCPSVARAAEGGLFGPRPPATPPAPDASSGLVIGRYGNMAITGRWPDDAGSLEPKIAAAAWASDAGKQALKELGLSDDDARAALSVTFPANGSDMLIKLTLPSDTAAARAAGVRFVTAVTERVVPPVLRTWADMTNHIPVERAQIEYEKARAVADALRHEAAKMRAQIREATGLLDASPEGVRGAASRLDTERQRISLELVGQRARQRALEERVAKLTEQGAGRVAADPVAAELEKIIRLKQEQVERLSAMFKNATVSQAEVAGAQAALSEARARLAERREAVGRAAGTDLLSDLTRELVMLTIGVVENEARLADLEKRSASLAKGLSLVDEFDRARDTADRAEQQAANAETRARAAARQAETSPSFSVTVHWAEPEVAQTKAQTAPK